jgi:hypothetical protein
MDRVGGNLQGTTSLISIVTMKSPFSDFVRRSIAPVAVYSAWLKSNANARANCQSGAILGQKKRGAPTFGAPLCQ